MADVSRNSDVIADLVAVPKVKGQPIRAGVVHSEIAKHTYVSGDSAPSLAIIMRIPAHARVKDLKLSHKAFTTAGAIDIGLHAESSPGVAGSAVDADFFATAASLSAAARDKASLLNESTTNTPAKQCQALWQAAGVASEPVPGTHYLLTATITTTINSTELDVVYEVDYVL